jgi:alanyl-tRNA synthetase
VESLLTEQQALKQQLGQLRHQLLTGGGGGGAGGGAAASAPSETINGIGFACRVFDDLPPAKLRAMADKLKQDLGSGIVLVATTAEAKVSLAVGVSDDLTQRFDAVTLVRQLVPIIGGQGGGGRPDMAQAGDPRLIAWMTPWPKCAAPWPARVSGGRNTDATPESPASIRKTPDPGI